ncbi:hypothetical protein [Streptomyces sp. NPDC051572]|uniref:hypothetical protein n=1 Tax=unclassified Streptomyces TaxID=2593676 RepID=UPI00344CD2B8|nr:hypothetical protein OG496_49225 [Streptomyces sp. NBC_00988]
MGRLAGLVPKVRISTRLTWTFSATTAPARSATARRRAPVSAAGLRASATLLGSVLRAARSRSLPPPPAGRTRGFRRG